MGLKYIEKVFGLDDLKVSERLVLMILGYHCNKTNNECWPAIKTIADEAHMEYSNTCKVIRGLDRKGYLVRSFEEGVVKRFRLTIGVSENDPTAKHTENNSSLELRDSTTQKESCEGGEI
jgi:DNA-binding MarR family transcriptional regulator